MTGKQHIWINELIQSLPEDRKSIYEKIMYYINDLGYIPQKNRSYLSFKHSNNGKIIAKISEDDIKIKFFACKNIPEKYINALRREMDANNDRYSMPVPPPNYEPVPTGEVMKKCTLLCNACTGGGMRYYYQFSDGKELFRCGAYPVSIPDIKEHDIDELKRLILEQHNYFLSIA